MTQGFKELSSVCQAIASGRQSVLLRKAGLRESTAESVFQAKSFYLLPTLYHEKGSKSVTPDFSISLRVEIIRAGDLLDWSHIEKIIPLTAYHPPTIREHFDSRNEHLLHFAHIRAFALSPIWQLPHTPALSGCRSWFDLPSPPAQITETAVPETSTIRQIAQLLA